MSDPALCLAVSQLNQISANWRSVTEHWRLGLQVSKEQFDKILQMCKQGEEQGAKLECGGKRLGDKGYYMEPTVFSNVQDDNIIATDEIFGPVQSILKWSTIDEVRYDLTSVCLLHFCVLAAT